MIFEILNVEHGFAAYAVASDGSVLLFDCGSSQSCRPSEYLLARGVSTIRNLFITNYDEDHIDDLPNVVQNLQIEILTRNMSLTSAQLWYLKEHPISEAMGLLLKMSEIYTKDVPIWQPEPQGVRTQTFYNNYPRFRDTNNLSLLTFLHIGDSSFVIPGDLEHDGWLALLKNPQVCQLLQRADIFIASHHGRESGYCRQVFDYCTPSLIIMSDGPVVHSTQRMAKVYGQHASGRWFHKNGSKEWRKVVTTRCDGHIRWEQ